MQHAKQEADFAHWSNLMWEKLLQGRLWMLMRDLFVVANLPVKILS